MTEWLKKNRGVETTCKIRNFRIGAEKSEKAVMTAVSKLSKEPIHSTHNKHCYGWLDLFI